ncbi:RNA ligase-domain-containing protein [Gongronella butleri]|nr:RNA ligase-domain-containing protein [Gongronella butleri]
MDALTIDAFNEKWLDEDHAVVEALYNIKKETKKDLRNNDFGIENDTWTSWNMHDHLYKKNRYPTMARGLFTAKQKEKYVVRVRGYDKFFNINETSNTQWPALTTDTKGPYEVSAKENGCIIFVAAVSETELIATSKHMIPTPKDHAESHGGVGYRWTLKHLKAAGRAPEELAQWLHDHRVTLVFELCDDEFEEHVVPYVGRERGLYLHGINYNATTLRTLPMTTVHVVADHFGFHKCHTKVFDDIKDIKDMSDHIKQNQEAVLARLGVHSDRECEGVVVRCQRRQKDGSYADFFFKIKNDQYLMYREYREVTRKLLTIDKTTGQPKVILQLPKTTISKIRSRTRALSLCAKSLKRIGPMASSSPMTKAILMCHWHEIPRAAHDPFFCHQSLEAKYNGIDHIRTEPVKVKSEIDKKIRIFSSFLVYFFFFL